MNMTNLFLRQSYQDAWEDFDKSLKKRTFLKWDYVFIAAADVIQQEVYQRELEERLSRKKLPATTQFRVVIASGAGHEGETVRQALQSVAEREQETERPFANQRLLVIHGTGLNRRMPHYADIGPLFAPIPRLMPDGRAATLFDEIMISMAGVPSRIPEGLLNIPGDSLLIFNALQIDARLDESLGISLKDTRLAAPEQLKAVLFDRRRMQELYEQPTAADISDQVDFSGELSGTYPLMVQQVSPAAQFRAQDLLELGKMLHDDTQRYQALDWQHQVLSSLAGKECTAYLALAEAECQIDRSSYLLYSEVKGAARIGKNSVLSHVTVNGQMVPAGVLLHGLRLKDDRYLVQLCGLKDTEETFLGVGWEEFRQRNRLTWEDIFPEGRQTAWEAQLYAAGETFEAALEAALALPRMAAGEASPAAVAKWRQAPRFSLNSMRRESSQPARRVFENRLEERIRIRRFCEQLQTGSFYKKAFQEFGDTELTVSSFNQLRQVAEQAPLSLRLRILYCLSRYMKDAKINFGDLTYDMLENECYSTIRDNICETLQIDRYVAGRYQWRRPRAVAALPVRVNWGGGWTDTPPYCIEQGGIVLNAALKMDGQCPVQVLIERRPDTVLEFVNAGFSARKQMSSMAEVRDCRKAYDPFVTHKAALLATGILPLTGPAELPELLGGLGGGLTITTRVVGVPKGSGLGVSSIMAAACIKGLYQLLGERRSDKEICNLVLGMEQLMGTGGGWQDQIGGLTAGIKYTKSTPSLWQNLYVDQVRMSSEAQQELNERLALIYTGQRIHARNQLIAVVGGYLEGRAETLDALGSAKRLAGEMRVSLEEGDIDTFAALLNDHWKLSCRLNRNTTNTCIDQILLACEDLIAGRYIAGPGGGGFLQVILKRGISKETLKQRLYHIFQDSGVSVWDSELLF